MDLGQYGVFANIVAIACALVATFSVMLLKMLGSFKRWAWLVPETPPFLATAGARILAVAVMATTYISIDATNYRWFGLAAVILGVLGRSEEHTSELQSLMRISYAVFCLKKKKHTNEKTHLLNPYITVKNNTYTTIQNI